jgi:SAM-dependent methyltransferase
MRNKSTVGCTDSSASPEKTMTSRSHCPACLSTALSVVYEEPYAAANIQRYLSRHYEGRASCSANDYTYSLASCDDCGLAFQKEVPDAPLLGELYNQWVPGTEFEREHRDYSLDEYRYLAEQVQFIIQHFKAAPSELRVLDFGFGWAHWSRMAMAYGCDVSGIELSQERVSHGEAIGIHVVDLNHLPKEKFRFINTEQVFEHLTEPREVLERLIESLTPDGLIKISVPDASDSLKQIRGGTDFGALSADQQMAIAPLEHINAFNYDSLVSFGKSLGLKPLRPSFFQLYNSASGLLQLKKLARVLARPIYRHIFPRSTFVYFSRA